MASQKEEPTVFVEEEQERTASSRYSVASSALNAARGVATLLVTSFVARASSSARQWFGYNPNASLLLNVLYTDTGL